MRILELFCYTRAGECLLEGCSENKNVYIFKKRVIFLSIDASVFKERLFLFSIFDFYVLGFGYGRGRIW